MTKNILTTLSILLLSSISWAQTCVSTDSLNATAYKSDVYFLANDFLEGREAGTKGEELAASYIIQRFEKIGLTPFFSEASYDQPFEIYLPASVSPSTELVLKGKSLRLNQDFYPIQQSGNGSLENVKLIDVNFGITAPELEYDDYAAHTGELEGSVLLMSISSPDGVHPHSKYLKYHDLTDRLNLAREKGAAAVIVFNPEDYLDHPERDFKRIDDIGIPVLFVQEEIAEQLKEEASIGSLRVEMNENPRQAHNLAGWLDRGAEQSIVIGAHYDHLGWGDEGSRYRGAEPMIHNGADDNASGTAGLLTLAEYFANHPEYNAYNLIFLAFSAEEKGLLGSKYFVKHSPIPNDQLNYMINMDMIGRLNEEHALVINGVGTSPIWTDLLEEVNCQEFTLKTTKSGVGPSDHTSFYLEEVPVLHFFSGTHPDYHRPEDDAHLINYEGSMEILAYIATLVAELDGSKPLEFTETSQEESTRAPRFRVTLGVMPDYTFEGDGMRIDAVTEGKPAATAGIQGGDVVTQMGDLKIRGMQSYMQALGQFQPGQETTVTILREGEEMELKVVF